jgi:hypothetical protein
MGTGYDVSVAVKAFAGIVLLIFEPLDNER